MTTLYDPVWWAEYKKNAVHDIYVNERRTLLESTLNNERRPPMLEDPIRHCDNVLIQAKPAPKQADALVQPLTEKMPSRGPGIFGIFSRHEDKPQPPAQGQTANIPTIKRPRAGG